MMKYRVYVLVGLLMTSGVFAAKDAYAQDNTWYPGDGLEKGLLVKYRLSAFDYKGGQPFEATIWFGEQDDTGNWITDVIIEDRGDVVTSKMTLSAFNLSPIGFDVSEEFQPYRSVIKGSLSWTGEYASQREPEPLSGNKAWGVIAAIGGGGIIVAPMGTETIQAAGQSWDTAVIGFHYAVDSKIWIKDGFPFPIKAKVYTIASIQPIPVQYEFELLETRMSDTAPIPPEEDIQLPTPPLSKPTTSGAFNVDLYWEPATIEPGKPITMGVVIFDRQHNVKRGALYDLLINGADDKVVLDLKKVVAQEGQGTHEVTFDSAGRFHVAVTYLGDQEGGLPETIIEKAEFDLIVVPEFPLGLGVVMAAMIGVTIIMSRFKKISIPTIK
jgi:hypothetical protein